MSTPKSRMLNHNAAVADLKAWFGVLSQDDLFNVLVGTMAISDLQKFNFDFIDGNAKIIDSASTIVNMLQSQERAFFTHQIIKKINEMATGSKADPLTILEIVYEAGGGTFESKTSMNELTKITPSPEGAIQINEDTQNPTKEKPSLAAFIIFPNSLNPAKRGTAGAELFMNVIPTIEMSRCVPFLDVALIPPTPPISESGKVQTVSLLQFLKGNFKPAAGSADDKIARGVDLQVKRVNVLNTPPPTGDEAKNREVPSTTSAGMEVFTMPQTMVSGDELYASGIPGATKKDPTGTRAAPVIDRFRPLMSIKDFKVDVTPSSGLITHKTASLSLVLHDRSRLSEIAEFVKPDLYGRTEMIITYGWSHPDGGLQGNVYGRFLDSLKCTEKYGIVNSSFTFDNVGQVGITLKLSLRGSTHIELTKIHEGEGVKDALKEVKRLTELIAAHRKKTALGRKGSKKISGGHIVSQFSDTNSAMNFKGEISKKINEYIANARKSKSPSVKPILPLLRSLKKEVPKAQRKIARLVAKKVATVKKNKINSNDKRFGSEADREKISDPFAASFIGHTSKFVNIPEVNNTHISLGALLLHFIGRPLCATGQFDEVQFVFYSFNSWASYVHKRPICQFPIKFIDFETKLKEAMKTSTNMSLSQFMGFISRKFISSQTCEAYGLTSLYDPDKKTKKLKLKKVYEDRTLLQGQKDLRLMDAYGKDADLKFRLPRIQYQAECLPGDDDGQSIYRIHIFDQSASPHKTLAQIWEASQSDHLATFTTGVAKVTQDAKKDKSKNHDEFLKQLQAALDKKIIEAIPTLTGNGKVTKDIIDAGDTKFRIKSDFQKVKDHLMSLMPTIVYGSSNTNITQANLASMNVPGLTNMHIRRAGLGQGTSALGVRESGVPLQIAPMRLSLQTRGFPMATVGQQFFIDFGTGTSADGIYCCSKVSHSIAAGTFDTSWEFQPLSSYGQYTNLGKIVDQAIAAIESDEGG